MIWGYTGTPVHPWIGNLHLRVSESWELGGPQSPPNLRSIRTVWEKVLGYPGYPNTAVSQNSWAPNGTSCNSPKTQSQNWIPGKPTGTPWYLKVKSNGPCSYSLKPLHELRNWASKNGPNMTASSVVPMSSEVGLGLGWFRTIKVSFHH